MIKRVHAFWSPMTSTANRAVNLLETGLKSFRVAVTVTPTIASQKIGVSARSRERNERGLTRVRRIRTTGTLSLTSQGLPLIR